MPEQHRLPDQPLLVTHEAQIQPVHRSLGIVVQELPLLVILMYVRLVEIAHVHHITAETHQEVQALVLRVVQQGHDKIHNQQAVLEEAQHVRLHTQVTVALEVALRLEVVVAHIQHQEVAVTLVVAQHAHQVVVVRMEAQVEVLVLGLVVLEDKKEVLFT